MTKGRGVVAPSGNATVAGPKPSTASCSRQLGATSGANWPALGFEVQPTPRHSGRKTSARSSCFDEATISDTATTRRQRARLGRARAIPPRPRPVPRRPRQRAASCSTWPRGKDRNGSQTDCSSSSRRGAQGTCAGRDLVPDGRRTKLLPSASVAIPPRSARVFEVRGCMFQRVGFCPLGASNALATTRQRVRFKSVQRASKS